MEPDVLAAIARLRSAWDDEVRPAARRALVAAGIAIAFGIAHLARRGTPSARALAAAALAAFAVGLVVRMLVLRRLRADVRQVVRLTVSKLDASLGARTLRALTLRDRTAQDAHVGSSELAALHLSRLLARTSVDRIGDRAARAARSWSAVALCLAVFALACVAVEPFRIIEGLDVLAAREGEAPLLLAWLDEVEMVARPPEYLHQDDTSIFPFSPTAQPRGTTLVVRGHVLHPGRQLVLTDGRQDVPFVDDGASGVVARWTVQDDAPVFIAARFGGVRVRQPDAQAVTAIPDEAPKVSVEGAPRTVRLLDEPNISIHYEATDDHGLREVNLVLRAGAKEERRLLSRPAADAKVDRGGYELRATDLFFKKTYLPVEVTVEARDNDPIAGPKWGKSAPITIVLPQVGEPEALRYAALAKARDALTDLLDDRLTATPIRPGGGKQHADHERQAQAAAVAAAEAALSGSYGGLTLRGRTDRYVRGQLRRLEQALEAERKAPADGQHKQLVAETEQVLLGLDGALHGLGARDTRSVARRLASVADETADAAALGSTGGDAQGSTQRLDAAVTVLDGGGKQLLRLGDLGLDLGEIVDNDLRRVARARAGKDLFHAELAARDLAARLRRPDPSFGGGGRGGVEAGGPPSARGGSGGDPEEESAASDRDLEQLARDHESEMNAVQEALERAGTAEEIQALRDEARRHAEAIREAIRGLPPPGGDPGSAEAEAGAGKEHAESMAGALERGQPREALDSGRASLKALQEAKRLGQMSGGFFPEERAGKEAGKAAETVERELAWAEQALDKLRRAAQDRAKPELGKSSKNEEGLAERARELGRRGETGDRAMPQEALDHLNEAERAMREAQRSLADGDGEQGLNHQKEAQRHLEMARGSEDQRDARQNEPNDNEGDDAEFARKAAIPGKDQHKGPEEFRRRVLQGLGSSSDPRLREAVRRYAEGLLR